MAKVAGTHSLLSKAAAGEHSRRTIRPAQASKKQLLQTMQLVGLAAKHQSQMSAGLAAKQQPHMKLAGLTAKQQPQMKLAGLLSCSAGWWREYGGAGT